MPGTIRSCIGPTQPAPQREGLHQTRISHVATCGDRLCCPGTDEVVYKDVAAPSSPRYTKELPCALEVLTSIIVLRPGRCREVGQTCQRRSQCTRFQITTKHCKSFGMPTRRLAEHALGKGARPNMAAPPARTPHGQDLGVLIERHHLGLTVREKRHASYDPADQL